MIPPKFVSTDLIPDELLALIDKPKEAFIEDIGDNTWGSIIYHKDRDCFSIYLDGRQLGEGFEKSVASIILKADNVYQALKEAKENADV